MSLALFHATLRAAVRDVLDERTVRALRATQTIERSPPSPQACAAVRCDVDDYRGLRSLRRAS